MNIYFFSSLLNLNELKFILTIISNIILVFQMHNENHVSLNPG